MKILKEISSYVVITLIVILIRTFIISPVRVDGTSMYPTLKNNEFLLLTKFDKSYERFDIVVLKHKNEKLVKRIIGLPGENVEYKDNILYINGSEVEDGYAYIGTEDFKLSDIGHEKIPNNYYFVVGDNRNNSLDSRMIGLINKKDLEGTIHISISGLKIVK